MTLEFQGTTVFGRQSMNLQSSRIDAKTNPVAAPTRRAQNSGTVPPPRRLATYSYSSFAPSSLRKAGQHHHTYALAHLPWPLQAGSAMLITSIRVSQILRLAWALRPVPDALHQSCACAIGLRRAVCEAHACSIMQSRSAQYMHCNSLFCC